VKVIYEKQLKVVNSETKEEELKMQKVSKSMATHKHICYHDEGKGRPCRMVKI